MERNGYKEETYHDFSYLPVRAGNGAILGVQNPTFEMTAHVVAERRLTSIRELLNVTSRARTLSSKCTHSLFFVY
jgi:hypothetical protein